MDAGKVLMDEIALSDGVARLLAWVWPAHREPSFLEYLSLTFSDSIRDQPAFDGLCLAEAESGDAGTGAIGSIIKQWWFVDREGFRATSWKDMPRLFEDFDDAQATGRKYYRFPLVRFFRGNMTVAFGEVYGPNLVCGKVGRVESSQGIVDVRLVWNVNSIGRYLSREKLPRVFDIGEHQWATK